MNTTCKMFCAAIVNSLETMSTDPATMAAVECLASGFASIQGMLESLWIYGNDFGLSSEFIGKDAALLTVTGKPFAYWASLQNDGKWFCGPLGSHFDCYYTNGKKYAYTPRGAQ